MPLVRLAQILRVRSIHTTFSPQPSASSLRRGYRLLAVEPLEERTLLSASLLSFGTTSGSWESTGLTGNLVQVTTVGRWDPYGVTAIVHGDFQGNGQTDVAGWSNLGYWLVGEVSGGQMQTVQWLGGWGAGITWRTFLVGDFTGDGIDDIAMLSQSGTWWVAVSTGNSFQMQLWSQPRDWVGGNAYRAFAVGDFSGNGLDDVAALTNQGGWQVGLSTGTGFQPQAWLPAHSWQAGAVRTVLAGDFTGDGLTDVAALVNGKWLVGSSTGTAFTSAVWGSASFPAGSTMFFQAGDFDGDGKADVLAMNQAGKAWDFTSTGSSFIPSAPTTMNLGGQTVASVNAGDFNGDGEDDVAIVTRAHTVWVAVSNGAGFSGTISAQLGTGNWVSMPAPLDTGLDSTTNNQVVSVLTSPGGNYITPADLALLRQDPSYFADLFQIYQYRTRAQLEAFVGAAVNDQAVAFALATVVAYQAAYYRGLGDPQGYFPPPRSLALQDLLAVPKLVCDEYCYLAAQLYQVVFPPTTDPGTTIQIIGFGSGPFGDHAQLIFASGGLSLLGDPTLGLVAPTSLPNLLQGVPVPAIDQLLIRTEVTAYMQQDIINFRAAVFQALQNGLYPEASLIYLDDLSNGIVTPVSPPQTQTGSNGNGTQTAKSKTGGTIARPTTGKHRGPGFA